jgi:hypothetical protein
MKPFTSNDIEAELSYAYVHAVAASACVSCTVSNRHADNAGVDAQLTGWGPFPDGGAQTEVDIKVQLKATMKNPGAVAGAWSYFMKGVARYDDLRSEALALPRILVVLFLPSDPTKWLVHTDDALSLQRCAYWVSLRGAPPSANDTGETVYLPRSQRFDRDGLRSLMGRISRRDHPSYAGVGAAS